MNLFIRQILQMKKIGLLKPFLMCLLVMMVEISIAQPASTPKNWYLLDAYRDGFQGISLAQALSKVSGKKSKTVVVAVIDSGVDAEHEDLKSVMWTNPGEVPGNGVDDDHNGYIDDVHGWNFIGGKNGNVSGDSYEVTRLYVKLKPKYENVDPSKLSKAEKKEYETFLNCKSQVESRREAAEANLAAIKFSEKFILDGLEMLKSKMGDQPLTTESINKIDEGDSKSLSAAVAVAKNVLESNEEIKSVDELKKLVVGEIEEGKKQFSDELNYAFNTAEDKRADIVGDRPDNVNERYYGNNDVEGPDAEHGTHVAGIIAAVRGNGIGMDGIATNVKIMSVRCVPNGDERDKDVANAIRYAVDNGASVINMSFGKGFSPNKDLVDEAVRYAASRDVLLVHAAGNSGADNDQNANFPNKYYLKKRFLRSNKAANWVEVGASTPFETPNIVADFSNYGKKGVDLFSPGVQIYSTIPNNEYRFLQGTSMASPVVAGVAALIRSYYPQLTASQVRKVLLNSVTEVPGQMNVPNQSNRKSLKEISVTGGVVNAAKALDVASKIKGRKKTTGTSGNGEGNSAGPKA